MKMKMKTTLTVLLIMELYGPSSGLIKQHFFVNEEMAWDSAKKHCKTHYHDLSTFTNENEQQQFLEYANETSDAWVGLYTESGVWKWSGDENATQIRWDTNQPVKDDDCAFIHKGLIYEAKCSAKYAFFCMNVLEFLLVRQNETWEGALEYCRTQFNDLASLSTMNMIKSASLEIMQAETEYLWTGLRYLAGDWFWLNGDDLEYTARYQTILPQCPARDLRCGAVDKRTRVLTHRNCEEKFHFLCQQKAQ